MNKEEKKIQKVSCGAQAVAKEIATEELMRRIARVEARTGADDCSINFVGQGRASFQKPVKDGMEL